LTASIYYLTTTAKEDGSLSASGTIETTQVQISSELGGLVAEVLVQEGDTVKAGAVLVKFDDALLQVQHKQAQAALAQAQANFNNAAALSKVEVTSAQQALDDLYENEAVHRAEVAQKVADARDAVRDADQALTNLVVIADQWDIDSAYANMILALDRLENAREDFEKYKNKPETNVTRAALLSIVAQRENEYDDAVRIYNNLISTANDIDINQAQADLTYAQEELKKLQADYDAMADGPEPDALELAQARLEAAGTGLDIAAAQVDTARANLEAVEVKLDKLVITAPLDGSVLFRSIEPGEVAQPGAPLMVLAKLEDLTITVYIQENRYGLVSLGDQATVKIDSFPGESFTAVVIRIADEAEFTPRNVQTAEGRQTTVFAIKLVVDDPQGKLKPGMPADVYFEDSK
jgi:HlyD family secretion protein